MNIDISLLRNGNLTSPGPPLGPQSVLTFGGYVAFPAARTLQFDGAPVDLGSRAFDLLILLLTSRGMVVSKEAIMRHVWPTTTVDESNLRFQMGVLRKALGANRGIIKTVPGRGYLLAGDVEHQPIVSVQTQSEHGEISSISEGEMEICSAICALLRTLARHPAAAPAVGSFIASQYSPAETGQFVGRIAG